MNRSEILDAAKQVVTQRQVLHGKPENCFGEIAEFWTTYCRGKESLTAHDVCMMMVLFKVVRAKASPENDENPIDGSGYFACGGEVAPKLNGDLQAEFDKQFPDHTASDVGVDFWEERDKSQSTKLKLKCPVCNDGVAAPKSANQDEDFVACPGCGNITYYAPRLWKNIPHEEDIQSTEVPPANVEEKCNAENTMVKINGLHRCCTLPIGHDCEHRFWLHEGDHVGWPQSTEKPVTSFESPEWWMGQKTN